MEVIRMQDIDIEFLGRALIVIALMSGKKVDTAEI